MSEQLTAAAQAMDVPEPLVDRSARAWADASGKPVEDVLTAWAGGEAVAAAPTDSQPAQAEPASEDSASEEPASEESAQPEPATEPAVPAEPAAPVMPAAAAVAVEPEPEPEPEFEPLSLGERLRLAGKIGAWTGAVMGLLGIVLSSTWLIGVTSLAGEEGSFAPAVEVMTRRFLIGITLLSIVFGVVVAAFSRTAAGWAVPGARLQGRFITTVAIGAGLGLALGLTAGGVMLSAFSEPIEGMEGVALMRTIPGVFLLLLGGAALGWITAALVQVMGVPEGLEEDDRAEIEDVRGRLSAAISIPLAAVLLLGLLVLPLGLTFIRSNEMAAGGAAVLAIFAAGSILGIAALAASRPTMRISFGEFLVAAAGIATVVLIIFAVIQTQAGPHEEEEEEAATEEEGETTETTAPEGEAVVFRIIL